MKLFSILNKPVNKAGNKQAGIVFLEYVIMAFIATVAVICAIWWFYWHLQQMTWEIKDRLTNLPRTCPLETPYGASPEEQPTLGEPIFFDIVPSVPFTVPSNYQNQTVTLQNYSLLPLIVDVSFDGGTTIIPALMEPAGFPTDTWSTSGTVTTGGPPYETWFHVVDGDPTGSFSVTITPGP